MKIKSVLVDAELLDELKIICIKEKISIKKMIEILIFKYLEKKNV